MPHFLPALIALFSLCFLTQVSHGGERPNIILIMVDDMGFSDLGCYGSEIDTPNLDQLAQTGLRMTQFYNCAKCETTRATLLSGLYHPEVEVGKLNNCTTIAQVMQSAGYRTLMTGKWHLSSNPIEKGFGRYFGHLSGATNFFTGDNTFRLDEEPFEVPSENFYTTDANTDYAIDFLKESPKDKPFFLYIAYNAPHYPLHARKEEFEKYRGKYKGGWDQLRETRLKKMQELGIVSPETQLSPRPADVPAWDSLDPEMQDTQELMMAAFAGMIDRVDQNLGRLVQHLKDTGRDKNTLIMFLSDNGACPFQRTKKETWDKKLMPYDPNSYWVYDKGWAHACNTPFREYKQNQHEGGISTAFIANWPAGLKDPGRIDHQPAHLVDIMATCVDLGKANYPEEANGQKVKPMRGHSLTPIFKAKQREQPESIYFTFYGKNNALRVGDYKLVNKDRQAWELYNIIKDRNEQHDLSKSHPEIFADLKAKWLALQQEIGTGKQGGGKKKEKS